MNKTVSIITDLENKKIIVINDIRFKGKRNINWEDVEEYLKEYVGTCYEVIETSDNVFIGTDFPGELKGSKIPKDYLGQMRKLKQMQHKEFLCY